MSESDLRYPIGRYTPPAAYTPSWRASCIAQFAAAPAALRAALDGLADEQLDTPYRPGGWTVRQLAHHVPDSHLNMYIRLKWTLTEDRPTIKAYDEVAWADLPDTTATPIEVSLRLLEAVHERAGRLFSAMSERDFDREYVHPESGPHSLHYLVGLYAWHGRHHVAHITALRARMGW